MKHLLLFFAACSILPAQDAFQVKVSGHGQPIILIPGLSSGGETWDSTVAHYTGAQYKDRFECHVAHGRRIQRRPAHSRPDALDRARFARGLYSR